MKVKTNSSEKEVSGSQNLKGRINEHWNTGAQEYDELVRDSFKPGTLRNRWQKILKEAVGDEQVKVLDVGTGPGTIAFQLADLGHIVTGMDNSEDMLKMAQKNAVEFKLPVEFVKGDAECIPSADGVYDVVISRHVLWTLTEPEKALAEWKRVLRPGGKLVIMDGNWHNNLSRSVVNQGWLTCAILLVSMLKRRNMANGIGEKKWEKELPLYSVERPDYDLKMLQGLGFTDMSVTLIGRHNMGLIEYLKYGYYGNLFMISARKKSAK